MAKNSTAIDPRFSGIQNVDERIAAIKAKADPLREKLNEHLASKAYISAIETERELRDQIVAAEKGLYDAVRERNSHLRGMSTPERVDYLAANE